MQYFFKLLHFSLSFISCNYYYFFFFMKHLGDPWINITMVKSVWNAQRLWCLKVLRIKSNFIMTSLKRWYRYIFPSVFLPRHSLHVYYFNFCPQKRTKNISKIKKKEVRNKSFTKFSRVYYTHNKRITLTKQAKQFPIPLKYAIIIFPRTLHEPIPVTCRSNSSISTSLKYETH